MPKKGVSADEKRQRLQDMFHEKKDFFQLKEVEKIASKEKGIVLQSVQEVLQSLIDDGLVEKDKVGTSVYFWSFPSNALQKRQNRLDQVTTDLQQAKRTREALEEKVAELRGGREESAKRVQLLQALSEKESQRNELMAKLAQYAENDPEAIRALEEGAEQAKECANRWTDNVFATLKWCADKFQRSQSELRDAFSIPESFDYV
eukprot:EC726595.1.p1 GENE.EC726595.1~~EC726595.1.p1  ORF type:complete len:204 (+),score=46.85 EC726595.1:89-700(+)